MKTTLRVWGAAARRTIAALGAGARAGEEKRITPGRGAKDTVAVALTGDTQMGNAVGRARTERTMKAHTEKAVALLRKLGRAGSTRRQAAERACDAAGWRGRARAGHTASETPGGVWAATPRQEPPGGHTGRERVPPVSAQARERVNKGESKASGMSAKAQRDRTGTATRGSEEERSRGPGERGRRGRVNEGGSTNGNEGAAAGGAGRSPGMGNRQRGSTRTMTNGRQWAGKAAALMCLTLIATGMQAARADSFLSNYGESARAYSDSYDIIFARFTTGDDANLVVQGFDVKLKRTPSGNLRATFCQEEESLTPVSVNCELHDLTKQVSGTKAQFRLPTGGVRLQPETNYYLRINNAGNDVATTTSKGTDHTGSGWEMLQAQEHESGETCCDFIGTSGSPLYVNMNIFGYEITGAKITDIEVTSSPRIDDTYVRGEVIEFTVSADKQLAADSTKTEAELRFKLGHDITRDAEYAGITNSAANGGSSKVRFEYTVEEDDEDTNGLWIGADVVQHSTYLRVQSDRSEYMSKKNNSFGTQRGHKIDGSMVYDAPEITDLSVTSTPEGTSIPNTYVQGEDIKFTATFSKQVKVVGSPQVKFKLSSTETRHAVFDGVDLTEKKMIFTYTVESGDRDDDGIWVPRDPVVLGDAKVYDKATAMNDEPTDADVSVSGLGRLDNHKVNGSEEAASPTITNVVLVGQTTLGLHDALDVHITFDRKVDIKGSPHVQILVGNNSGTEATKKAYFTGRYTDGSAGKLTPVFRYIVQAGDVDTDGVRVATGSSVIQVEAGESVTSTSTGVEATLTYGSSGHITGRNIDATDTSNARTITFNVETDTVRVYENRGTVDIEVAVTVEDKVDCNDDGLQVRFWLEGPSTGVISGDHADIVWENGAKINALRRLSCSGLTIFKIKAPQNDNADGSTEGNEVIKLRMDAVFEDHHYVSQSRVRVEIYEENYEVKITDGDFHRMSEYETHRNTLTVAAFNSSGEEVRVGEDTKFKLTLAERGGHEQAEEGQDYRRFDNGQYNKVFTIEEGQSSVEIRIPIIDDDDAEKYEHFSVRIDPPPGVSQIASVPVETHTVRIYSEEYVMIGHESHAYLVDEGDSVELCVIMNMADGRYEKDPAFAGDEGADDYNFVFGEKGRRYLRPGGRVGFGFGLTFTPLHGTADIDDDYEAFATRELQVPKGTPDGGKVCKTFRTLTDAIPETTEKVEVVVERLPGVNAWGQIKHQPKVGDLYRAAPHFVISINDPGDPNFGGGFEVEAAARAGRIDLSWGPVSALKKTTDTMETTATRYVVRHRQPPFGCKMGWSEPDDFDGSRQWVIQGERDADTEEYPDSVCPWTEHPDEDGLTAEECFGKNGERAKCSVRVKSSAHSGGVIEKVNIRVFAYWGPNEEDLLAQSPPVKIDPRQTSQVEECQHEIRNTAREPVYIDDGNGNLVHAVEDTDGNPVAPELDRNGLPVYTNKKKAYASVTEQDPTLCIGPTKIIMRQNSVFFGWSHVSGATGYRIEWKLSDAARENDWSSADSKDVGVNARCVGTYQEELDHQYCETIQNLLSGKTYHVRITAKGMGDDREPSKTHTFRMRAAAGEEVYHIRFTEDEYIVGEGQTLMLVCVKFERIDGERIDGNRDIGTALSFQFETVDVTAVSAERGPPKVPGDYWPLTDTITFRGESTECRSIFLINDDAEESDETFTVNVSPSGDIPSHIGVIQPISTDVTIIGNEGHFLSIEGKAGALKKSVTEGAPSRDWPKMCARIKKNDRGTTMLTENVPIRLTVTSEDANEGTGGNDDYTIEEEDGSSWTRIHPPTAITVDSSVTGSEHGRKCFRLRPTNGDYNVERNESVTISVGQDPSTPSGYQPLETVSTTVEIIDNDVVEGKIERVIYEVEEGEPLTVAVVYESANTNSDCLIGFDTYFRIGSTPHTATFKEDPENPLPENAENYPLVDPDNCQNRRDCELDIEALNRDLPIEKVDGYWTWKEVTMPACHHKVKIPMDNFEDIFVERQTEQYFIAIHPVNRFRDPDISPEKINPAGLRINSRSRVDIKDDDTIQLLFANLGELEHLENPADFNDPELLLGVDWTREFKLAKYTAEEGSTIDVGWTARHPDIEESAVEFTFSFGLTNVGANKELLEIFTNGVDRPANPNFTTQPYQNEGTFQVKLGEVDEDTKAYVFMDGSLLRFQDSILTNKYQLVEITITNSDSSGPSTYIDNGVLEGLRLVDTESGDVTALTDAASMYLDDGKRYAIEAVTQSEASIGSVKFTLSHPDGTSTERIEEVAPWSLWGDTPDKHGNRVLDGSALTPGSYTLTVTAYSDTGASGTNIGTITVGFGVTVNVAPPPRPAIRGFTLVNAGDQSTIAYITPGAQIDLGAHYGSDIAIKVETEESQAVESVVITLSGAKSASATENLAPWSLYGDTPDGADARTLNGEALPAGTYTLEATAYAEDGGAGAVLGSLSESFEVIEAPQITVGDARAEEGTDTHLSFAVQLDRAAIAAVEVDYATADNTATAGEDYTAASGTLRFEPGEQSKTIKVAVLDDAEDEGEETMWMRLSNASAAELEDAEGVGTITNSDPIQKMWLARFGRTVASQVMDAVSERLAREGATRSVTIAGQTVELGADAENEEGLERIARAMERGEEIDANEAWPRASEQIDTLGGRETLLGSAFHLSSGGEAGATQLTAWGRVSESAFEAEETHEKGVVDMHGTVTSAILGADAAWDRWLAGIAFSVSEGSGGYAYGDVGHGGLESTLSAVHPYARYRASERLDLWGLVGMGTGTMTLLPGERDRIETGISMRLAGAGARLALVPDGGDSGFSLDAKTDAFTARMDSERAANTEATRAEAHRMRASLEGTQRWALSEAAALNAGLEVGVRYDAGDAETGAGVELGASVGYDSAASGWSAELRGRTLIAHEARGMEEWGLSGAIALTPADGRGLSLQITPVIGDEGSELGTLWGAGNASEIARGGGEIAGMRLDSEIGYGTAVLGQFTGTPYVGMSLAEDVRDWRLGWRLETGGRGPDLSFGVEMLRSESTGPDSESEQSVRIHGELRW